MRIILLIALTFMFNTSFSYEENLYAFLNDKTQENFKNLEKSFDLIQNRNEKSRLAFILFNSDFETTKNKKSYYSLYALKFYKGKDFELLSNAFLRVISIFYYQGNLSQAKVYLKQLKKKDKLNQKSIDLINYYEGLIHLSEKKYDKGIITLTKLYQSTKNSTYKKVIPAELARASLLAPSNLQYINGTFFSNKHFIKGIIKFIKTTPDNIIKNILIRNQRLKLYNKITEIILKNTTAFDSPCSIVRWMNKHKRIKHRASYQSYSHLISACYMNKKKHKELLPYLRSIKLFGIDRILRAVLTNSKSSCTDLISAVKESNTLTSSQATIVLSNINKHCKDVQINKNKEIISNLILKNEEVIIKEVGHFNIENILANTSVRNEILYSLKTQVLVDFTWHSFSSNPSDLAKALMSNRTISSKDTIENILRILLTWDNQDIAQASLNHKSLLPYKQIYNSLFSGQGLIKSPSRICNNGGLLEKEALLRGFLTKKDTKSISKNYKCLSNIVENNDYYQDTIVSIWVEKPHHIKHKSKYANVLNFLHKELTTPYPAKWEKEFSNFINKKNNYNFLQYRYFKLHSSKIRRGKNLMDKIKSIKKMSYWFNNINLLPVLPTAKNLLNQAIDQTIRHVNREITKQEQKESLIHALQKWRIDND